jgi:Ca2+-binding EF-hand superfamily protein
MMRGRKVSCFSNVLSEDSISCYRYVFNLFDKDCDGILSNIDICDMLASLNLVSYVDSRQLAKRAHLENITFFEFMEFMSDKTNLDSNKPATPRRIEDKFDRTQRGALEFMSKNKDKKMKNESKVTQLGSSLLRAFKRKQVSSTVVPQVQPTTTATLKKTQSQIMRPSLPPLQITLDRKYSMGSYLKNQRTSRSNSNASSSSGSNELEGVFKHFDHDKNGIVTVTDIMNMMYRLGIDNIMTATELKLLVDSVSKDGTLTFSQFQQLYKSCY